MYFLVFFLYLIFMSVADKILEFLALSFKLGSYIVSIIFVIFLLKKYYEYKEKYKDDDK